MSLSKESFDQVDWQGALQDAEHPICWMYVRQFAAQAKVSKQSEDETAVEIFKLLQAITAPRLKAEDDTNPLNGIDKIPEDQLRVLSEVFEDIEDPELRARIADVLWLRKISHQVDGPHVFGLEAIDAYPEAADRLIGAYNNKPTFERFARALDLARQMGQEKKLEKIVSLLEDRIRKRSTEETTWHNRRYSELLYERGLGDPTEQARLMKASAQAVVEHNGAEREAYLGTSRKYWQQAAKWHARAGNDEGRFQALTEVAEWHAQRAELEESNLVKAECLADAYDVYQKVPNAKDRKEEIHRALLRAQEQAVQEFGRIATQIADVKQQAEAAATVQTDDLQSALVDFAFVENVTPLTRLEEQTRSSAQATPLQVFIGGKQVNALGRVTANKPSVFEDEEAAFEHEVFKTARFSWTFAVANRIEPARSQICETHEVDVERILPFLEDNPLVPPGREGSFAIGLSAGFNGDFLTAAHFLCTQFEESVRYLLRREGAITSGFAPDKTQYERNLNNFLDPEHEDYRSPVLFLFGRDVAFHFQALLIDERGANLRNEVAHALLPDSAYEQAPAIYFWWLVWHLIIYGSPHVEDWLGGPIAGE